jgi:hypothetical protein
MHMIKVPLRPRSDALLFLAHAAVMAAVAVVVFARMKGILFSGLDGASMLSNVSFEYRLTPPAAGFFADPLQGLGDIWFNFNAWLSPGYLLPALFFGWDGLTGVSYRVAVYTVHALFLFLAVAAFARTLDMRQTEPLVGAWVTFLFVFPVYGAPFIYPILQLQPNLAFTIAESYLLLLLFSLVGRRLTASWGWLHSVVLAAAITVIAGHFLLIAPTSIFLALPFLIAGGIGLLLGACDRREIAAKVVAGLTVVVILAIFGFYDFVLGIFRYTAAAEHGADFENARTSWYFVSIAFQEVPHGPGGPALFVAGVVGLFDAAIFGERRVRAFARLGLAYAAAIVGFGAATVLHDFWKGPSPIYMETLIWPVYALFAGRLVLRLLGRLSGLIWGSHAAVESGVAMWGPRVLLPLAVVVTLISVLRPAFPDRPLYYYAYPPKSNEIIAVLREQIGLAPGAPVAGRVATFSLKDRPDPVGWMDLHAVGALRDQGISNDLHLVGFWHFGIPTLIAYAPTLSPQLYALTVSLLARGGDHQMRNVLVLREPRLAALRTFGVTDVVTDGRLGEGFREIASVEVPKGEPVRLYAVDGAVRAAASPTRIRIVESLADVVALLREDDFNPLAEAILFPEDAGGVDAAKLAAATGVEVRLALGGLRVVAESPGRSVLYLPFQFSHCLRLQAEEGDGGGARLLRMNGIGTGILFDRRLAARLVYFTGPFDGARCRLEDLKAYRRIAGERR